MAKKKKKKFDEGAPPIGVVRYEITGWECVLLVGTIYTGFKVIGPFDDEKTAEKWADENVKDEYWELFMVDAPEEEKVEDVPPHHGSRFYPVLEDLESIPREALGV